MSVSPYDYICEPIEEWCKKNYYTDFLVTIRVGDREITEYLGLEDNASSFVWEYDWWEGEEDVRLLGFAPVDGIKLHNYPVTSNSDRIRSLSDEELAVICEDGCPPGAPICNSVETIEGETMKEHCQRCWLNWLKAPVEEDE